MPRTGRIKFGTESNGGFRNIIVTNCVFDGCEGVALESMDGALLEDVTISNITMRDIVHDPFFIRLGRRMRNPPGRPVGTLQRVIISNVVYHNSASRRSSLILGVPNYLIRDIGFHDSYVEHQGGGTAEMQSIKTPEQETEYPDPGRFGTMATHGFLVRHVKNIEMSNIEIICAQKDMRPAFALEDVQGAEFFAINAPHEPNIPTFDLTNART